MTRGHKKRPKGNWSRRDEEAFEDRKAGGPGPEMVFQELLPLPRVLPDPLSSRGGFLMGLAVP